MRVLTLLTSWCLGFGFLLAGCGDTGSNTSPTGGVEGIGAATGGAPSTGGAAAGPNAVGGTSTGGVATGGAPGTGGPTAAGGTQSGGSTATGGTTATGGVSATGGTTASGATGGGPAGGTGGEPATGGTSGTGGAISTGGVGGNVSSGSGGASETGGTGGQTSGGEGGSGTATGGTDVVDPTPVGQNGRLAVVGTELHNEHGVAIQLKGPSSMWLNWEDDGYASSSEGLAWIRDNWKATIVRAAMGISTTDQRDPDYLSDPVEAERRLRAVVDNAIANGMYVIIDWHDSEAHLHEADAIEFFTRMATDYGDLPNVLYETFNEPLSPNASPFGGGDAQPWDTVVKPYHEAVVTAIRDVDPDNVIILGTPNWSQYVDVAADDRLEGSNLMYTLHFYSCSHAQDNRDLGAYALQQGLPIFVTEWGATDADGGTPDNPGVCLEEAQAWHDWMTANKIGWAAWKWDNCVDESCYFPEAGAPITGGWTDSMLHEHARFVRDRMME